MGDISIVALVVIGLNVLVSWKGFNDLAFLKNINFKLGRYYIIRNTIEF